MTSFDPETGSDLDDIRPGYRRSASGGVRLMARAARRLLRAWRRILIATLLVAAVIVIGWLPRWMLSSARAAAEDCSWRIHRTGEGAAADCRQDDRLWLAKLAPWTRTEARAAAAEIDAREAADALDLAVRRDLDLDAATGAALEVVRKGAPPRGAHDTGFLLRAAGADLVLVTSAARLETANERALALDVAVRTGAENSIRGIAALAPGRGPAYRFEKQRGAALCALGDRAAGLAALDRAIAAGDGDLEPHAAIALCDPARAAKTPPKMQSPEGMAYLRAIGGAQARPVRSAGRGGVAPIVALHMMTRAGKAPLREVLPIIAPAQGGLMEPPHAMQSPWSILALSGHPAAPAWGDAAAAGLAQLADEMRSAKRDVFDRDDPQTLYIAPEALRDPAGALRWAAAVLALDAAVGWVRRGDAERARASASTAAALATHADLARSGPRPPLLAAAVLHLVGQRDAARAALDVAASRAAADDAETRGELALQRALLLATEGRAADAWTALDAIMKPGVADELSAGLRNQARWLRAALALRLRRPLDVQLPRPPDRLEYGLEPAQVLAYWWTAAVGDERVRQARRWHASTLASTFDGLAGVLPAALHVVGHAAGGGAVEVWLGAITSMETISPQAMMSARAEAARWRGDVPAAKRWEMELAQHRALATDDRSAALFDLARW